MQKAYHDLKEQALRMSIEQDAQKSQIEEEIKKLKISNQDLIKKNKVTFLQHSKSYNFLLLKNWATSGDIWSWFVLSYHFDLFYLL